jgi:hypothetical protein
MANPSKAFSLVKYDTPILVSKSFGKQAAKGATGASNSAVTSASSNRSQEDNS